jgi:hypothetical protein
MDSHPGVLRMNVKKKGLHEVAMRKCMKTKGSSSGRDVNDRRSGEAEEGVRRRRVEVTREDST